MQRIVLLSLLIIGIAADTGSPCHNPDMTSSLRGWFTLIK